jgi:t-SNARE complex subunit (syntaxin)
MWTWYDNDDEVLTSGTFLVGESTPGNGDDGNGGVTDGTINQIQLDLQNLEYDVIQLNTDLQMALLSIESLATSTKKSLDDLETTFEEAIEDAAKSKVDAEEAKALASDAKTQASNIQGTAEEAKNLANEIKTDVEQAKADAEKAVKSFRRVSIMVYVALGVSLVAVAMVFVGPIRISRSSRELKT